MQSNNNQHISMPYAQHTQNQNKNQDNTQLIETQLQRQTSNEHLANSEQENNNNVTQLHQNNQYCKQEDFSQLFVGKQNQGNIQINNEQQNYEHQLRLNQLLNQYQHLHKRPHQRKVWQGKAQNDQNQNQSSANYIDSQLYQCQHQQNLIKGKLHYTASNYERNRDNFVKRQVQTSNRFIQDQRFHLQEFDQLNELLEQDQFQPDLYKTQTQRQPPMSLNQIKINMNTQRKNQTQFQRKRLTMEHNSHILDKFNNNRQNFINPSYFSNNNQYQRGQYNQDYYQSYQQFDDNQVPNVGGLNQFQKNKILAILQEEEKKKKINEYFKQKMIQKMVKQSQHQIQLKPSKIKSQSNRLIQARQQFKQLQMTRQRQRRQAKMQTKQNSDLSKHSQSYFDQYDQNQKVQQGQSQFQSQTTQKSKKRRGTVTLEDIQNLKSIFEQKEEGLNISFRSVAKNLGNITHNTVRRLFASWKEDPTMRKQYSKMSVKNKQNRTVHSRTKQRIQIIDQKLKQQPFMLQKQLGNQLKILEGKGPQDCSFIRRVLLTGGYTRIKISKISSSRNDTYHIEKRFRFCTNFQKCLKKYEIYHLSNSEYLFHANMYKETFLAKKSECVDIKQHPYRQKTVNFVCIVGANGHFAYDCKIGQYSQQQYIKVMMLLLKSIPKSNEQVLVLVPAAQSFEKDSSNKQQVLRLVCTKNNYKFDILPEDSPQLNPIQSVVRDLKNNMKKMNYVQNEEIIQNLQNLSVDITQTKVKQYYESLDYYIQRAIKKQTF